MASDFTCGTCKHLHDRPPDPSNLGSRVKECRQGPPQQLLIPQGPGRAALVTSYPAVPQDLPACGQYAMVPHVPSLSLLLGDEQEGE